MHTLLQWTNGRCYISLWWIWCATLHAHARRQASALYGVDTLHNNVHHTCLTMEDDNTSADVRQHSSSLTATEGAHSSPSIATTSLDWASRHHQIHRWHERWHWSTELGHIIFLDKSKFSLWKHNSRIPVHRYHCKWHIEGCTVHIIPVLHQTCCYKALLHFMHVLVC